MRSEKKSFSTTDIPIKTATVHVDRGKLANPKKNVATHYHLRLLWFFFRERLTFSTFVMKAIALFCNDNESVIFRMRAKTASVTTQSSKQSCVWYISPFSSIPVALYPRMIKHFIKMAGVGQSVQLSDRFLIGWPGRAQSPDWLASVYHWLTGRLWMSSVDSLCCSMDSRSLQQHFANAQCFSVIWNTTAVLSQIWHDFGTNLHRAFFKRCLWEMSVYGLRFFKVHEDSMLSWEPMKMMYSIAVYRGEFREAFPMQCFFPPFFREESDLWFSMEELSRTEIYINLSVNELVGGAVSYVRVGLCNLISSGLNSRHGFVLGFFSVPFIHTACGSMFIFIPSFEPY